MTRFQHPAGTRTKRHGGTGECGENDEFSVIAAIGGVRGVVESMLPGLLFVVLFICTLDLRMTVVASPHLPWCRWSYASFNASRSWARWVVSSPSAYACLGVEERRGPQLYMYGLITNAAYIVLLLVSMAVRVPGSGFLVEFIRSLPTEHFKAWLSGWRSDRALYKAYARITWLWIGLFALRLIVQVRL